MVGSNAGAAVLGLASATNNSGWSGIALLLFCSIITNYTAHIIGTIIMAAKAKNTTTKEISSFSDIAEVAFGKLGRAVSNFSIYVTLIGVIIIYLILIGQLLNGLFPCFPHGFFTLAVGVIMMPIVVIIKSMKEAKWSSYFALSTTYIATILALILALSFYLGDDYENKSQNNDFSTTPFKSTIALGFSTYVFSLGAHPIFPNLYEELNNKQQWGMVVNLGWIIVCALYFATAIIGYLIFGNSLNGNDTLLATLGKFIGPHPIVHIGEILFCAHFICAIPIFATPCFYALNEHLKSIKKPFLGDKLNRIVIIFVLIIIAIFFPYFSDIMGLISDISTSLAVLILPALFYWKLCKTTLIEKIWLVIIIFFGLAGSMIGIYQSVEDLVTNVQNNPISEFFKEVFYFNMTLCFN